MAGRPTFKSRKIVIEPAVDVFLSISKVINAASMKMKKNLLAREENNGSRTERKENKVSAGICPLCVRISNLLKEPLKNV